MNKKAQNLESLVKEIVIGFGFLEGIWIAIGMNPESEILNAFIPMLQSLNTPPAYIFLMQILPSIIFIGTMIGIYFLGGWLGILAVVLAFIAGISILYFPLLGFLFLVMGIGLGYLAFSSNSDY